LIARGLFMASDEIEVILSRGPDDPKTHEPAYQKELDVFSKVLRESAVSYSQRGMAFDSAAGGGFPLGDYILPLATGVLGVVGTACVAWLQGRAGRKVRLKIGDVEAEARTTEEVNVLLMRAAEFRGEGFARAENVMNNEDWISAAAALALLKPVLGETEPIAPCR
jgi:hypothetical protein